MNQATEKLVTDFKVLMSDSEDLVKATAAQTGDKLVEVRNRIQRSAADLKPKLAEAEAALKAKAVAVAKNTDEYVHAKPWQTAGMAACVGLVIGLLIGRNR